VIWSNEEGTHYGRGLFGSRAVVGEFERGELDEKDEQGMHIRDAVGSVKSELWTGSSSRSESSGHPILPVGRA
jgi:hypothetical protein